MNAQTTKTVIKIKEICDQYLQNKISIVYLQATLSAFCTNFENDVPLDIQRGTRNLVEDLEYIRFMYDEHEHFEAVRTKLMEFNVLLSQYGKSLDW